jgi:hypothetical protein
LRGRCMILPTTSLLAQLNCSPKRSTFSSI